MTIRQKIYIALGVAAVLAIGIICGSLWSDHRIGKLETTVETAVHEAEDIRQKADRLEQAAGEYKAKIDYLENELTRARAEALKQDEKLQQTHSDTRNARSRVDATRRARTIDTTEEELCRKLADVGHPCQ